MLNLAGLKKVDCAPIRKSTASSSQMFCSWNPTAAIPMMTTSANLTRRIRYARS